MKASSETLEGNKVKLTVELEDSEVETAIAAAFRKIAHQVAIPGFRPGKAPRRLLEAKIGTEAARSQALQDALPGYYTQAVIETGIDPIVAPTIDITGGETQGPVIFEATVEVLPVPTLAGYQGLQVIVPNPEPSPEDIDRQIERLQRQFGDLQQVERPAVAGDFVFIDISTTLDEQAVPGLTAQDYSYEVGSSAVVPELDEQLTGAKVGDILAFTAPAPPPTQGELAFRILIKQVQERVLPEVTDEWANDVSEFDTVEELRNDIADRTRKVRKVQSARAFSDNAVLALAELVDVELPEVLIARDMERRLQDFVRTLLRQGIELGPFLEATGQSQEDFAAQLRSAATEAVRADLALRSLVAKEDLVATDEEVDTQIQSLAEQFGQKPARLRRDLERAQQLPAIRLDIRKTKAIEWLLDHVDVVDEEGRPIERSALRFDTDLSIDEISTEVSSIDNDHDHDHPVEVEGETTA